MNIPITELMGDCLKEIPQEEIKNWFARARAEQYELIRVRDGATFPLTDIQARVILLDELENYFQRARQNQITIIEQ